MDDDDDDDDVSLIVIPQRVEKVYIVNWPKKECSDVPVIFRAVCTVQCEAAEQIVTFWTRIR